jgi:hypothetical protein
MPRKRTGQLGSQKESSILRILRDKSLNIVLEESTEGLAHKLATSIDILPNVKLGGFASQLISQAIGM